VAAELSVLGSAFSSAERVDELLEAFRRQRIVVVGDMVADEYLYGHPARISREAPVVVLEFVRRRLVPGGATNVAVNLRSLGASVEVVGAIGNDVIGQELATVLVGIGIGTAGLIVDPGRPTSTKTRIIGGGAQVVHQQMVRIDRVSREPLPPGPRDALLQATAHALEGASGLILSDYEHGVLDPHVIAACLPSVPEAGIVTTVDSHGDLFRFQGVTLATPNQPEAEATLKHPMPNAEALRTGGQEILQGMGAQGLLLTRGSEGMVVLDRHGLFQELPAYNVAEVSDVTGAGDTVAAVATLVLCAGGSLVEAAVAGTVAAGLVVRRLGAATTNVQELGAALRACLTPRVS
jgi:rfaE bifunctional protein kinase chain/domain